MSDEDLSNFDAVLFDLDETLIDAPAGLEAAHGAVVDKLFKHFSAGELGFSRRTLLKRLSDFDDRMNRKRRYDRDEWWPEFIEENGLDIDLNESQINELTETYWSTYADAAVPYPSASSVLEYLSDRGYKLGVITDTDGSGIPKRSRLSDLEFFEMFETVVVGGEDTEKPKPDEKPFEMALSELGSDPENCVMVGDKPFTDIAGGNSLGMKTVLVRRRDWGEDEEPDYVIDSLTELKEFL